MKDLVKENIYDIVGDSICVSTKDGQKVYKKIVTLLKAGNKVVIFFTKVEVLTASFLTSAIGQLYGEFSEEQIRELLFIDNMNYDDRELLKRVVNNVKAYFKNPKEFGKAWEGISE